MNLTKSGQTKTGDTDKTTHSTQLGIIPDRTAIPTFVSVDASGSDVLHQTDLDHTSYEYKNNNIKNIFSGKLFSVTTHTRNLH